MINNFFKIIFTILAICSYNLHTAAKEKYLPIEITDNDMFYLKIAYDDTNRITETQTKTFMGEDRIDSTRIIYSYDQQGMLNEERTRIRVLYNDSLVMNVDRKDKYKYQASDSVININIVMESKVEGDTYLKDTLNETKILLNKNGLPYKIITLGNQQTYSNTRQIKYDSDNQIIQIEDSTINKLAGSNIYSMLTEILEFEKQKNVFSDVTNSNLLQIPIQNQLFFLFTKEIPSSIKLNIDNKDINYTKISCKLDDKGYPIEINSIETREGKKPLKSTLFVKYKRVNN